MIAPQTLANLKLFAGLSPDQIAALTAIADEVFAPQGTTLFRVGDDARQVYILLEGKVTVQVRLSSTPQYVDLTILNQPGELIGWSGMMGHQLYTAQAVTLSDSRLLLFDGEALLRVLQQDCEMGFTIMYRTAQTISDRMRNVQQVFKTF